MLSHETQPFVYAGYTIFVAEVPSTLNEALLLDFMLARARTTEERIVLLQHAIDGIVGTFYNQVLFADFELEAHRLVEHDQPITSETLSGIYSRLLGEYWGDALSPDPARAAHLGAHPALLPVAVLRLPVRDVLRVDGEADGGDRRQGRRRSRRSRSRAISTCCSRAAQTIRWSCSKTAGVDLSKPETVQSGVGAA